MFILVLNAGSSSLRFSLFDKKLNEVYKGHVDAIGLKTCNYPIKNHEEAIAFALKKLQMDGAIQNLNDIKKVAHRVVHGGEKYIQSTAVNARVLNDLKKLSHLAPLHNPINLSTLEACQKKLPKAKHFAVFDTAFHHTLPERAFLYGLPYTLYKKAHLRRYGFHGTSHKYIAGKASKLLKKKNASLITCHIGNGVSLTAIKNGKALDTTMGYTPLEGPMMGTRSGTVDPGIVLELVKQNGLKKTGDLLQKESGFKGLSGLGSDIRTLWAKPKDPGTLRTFDVFSYQMAKLILSLYAPLGTLPDAIIFTAGIGENAYYLRAQIMKYLEPFGITLDLKANKANGTLISNRSSKTKVFVIPTNEALEMAEEILHL